ncbi:MULTISPECIES: DNA-binding protein [unclassified Microbacterium]|uniref:DNA-binding protein n=1 Tax=unclassified Microbacterium TaxID=2609290 RepID=UPI0011AFBBAB|nr:MULTISPECIES: DNA-binding protein [unclassified Microbacterium]
MMPTYLSPAQVCELLPGMTEEILESRRKQRLDPPYFKPTGERGKVVLYDRAEVLAWVQRNRVQTRAGAT